MTQRKTPYNIKPYIQKPHRVKDMKIKNSNKRLTRNASCYINNYY